MEYHIDPRRRSSGWRARGMEVKWQVNGGRGRMWLEFWARVICVPLGVMALTSSGVGAQSQCPSTGVAVQILGSGGPRAGTGRASASYLVWVDGRARVMVDVGGGSFVRFGESGAELADLDLLAISHLHPDHVTDLPGLLWLSDAARQAPLAIAGPSGSDGFPSLPFFLSQLFDPVRGAFQILSGTLGGPGRGVLLEPTTVDVARSGPMPILQERWVTVHALPVPHGNVPALAYRVAAQGTTVVFSSDQNGGDPRFVDFSRDATALVMHMAVAPTTGPASDLHASPGTVGQVAADASVQQLILSHLFVHDGPEDLEGALGEIGTRYTGAVRVGEDLACYPP